MEYQSAKEKFLQAWGTVGSDWGISRTMAQIHALLLIAPEPLCVKDIMDELQISIGNVNMNLRALMDWGLVYKELKTGERKEYFVAEKNMWDVVRKIIANRKRRELEPVLKVLDEVSAVQGDSAEVLEFLMVVKEIRLFSSKADSLLETLLKADSDWFVKSFLKMVK
ncbi:MAG: ArsR family transcriptional regulator [Saprospiraceae bacterium]|nr:ArsR family transcriptional regulator [Saprospiraceae bacterium]